MFCSGCGKPSDREGNLCEGCEKQNLEATLPVPEEHPSRSLAPAIQSSLGPTADPYPVRFVTSAVTLVFFACTAAFGFAKAAAMDDWASSPTAWVALAATYYFYLKMREEWTLLRASSVPPIPAKLMKISLVYLALFLTATAVSGNMIGSKRFKRIRLNQAFEQLHGIQTKIREKRSAVEPTIEAYVEMYLSLGPDLDEYEELLRRIPSDMAAISTEDSHALTDEFSRISLIRRQIVVAEKINAAESEDQKLIWQTEMQPLLTAEGRLDKK